MEKATKLDYLFEYLRILADLKKSNYMVFQEIRAVMQEINNELYLVIGDDVQDEKSDK